MVVPANAGRPGKSPSRFVSFLKQEPGRDVLPQCDIRLTVVCAPPSRLRYRERYAPWPNGPIRRQSCFITRTTSWGANERYHHGPKAEQEAHDGENHGRKGEPAAGAGGGRWRGHRGVR